MGKYHLGMPSLCPIVLTQCSFRRVLGLMRSNCEALIHQQIVNSIFTVRAPRCDSAARTWEGCLVRICGPGQAGS
ncbi:hypothetical protein BGW80DRAFT_1277805 [Lactifluus volemus]|nr:hypothetical protein BGW80DRAFT_1277805 [Lactifluus volemus]